LAVVRLDRPPCDHLVIDAERPRLGERRDVRRPLLPVGGDDGVRIPASGRPPPALGYVLPFRRLGLRRLRFRLRSSAQPVLRPLERVPQQRRCQLLDGEADPAHVVAAASAAATRSTSDSFSSGYSGRLRTSELSCSLTRSRPLTSRSAYPGC